jgi:Cys-tRNA(Pro)/Cys-tRNA(Cys) deacylase
MRDALSVHRVLLERGVEHEVVRLPRPLQTADDLPEVLGLPATSCAVVRCYVVAPGSGLATAAGDHAGRALHAVVVPAGRHPLPGMLQSALRIGEVREATSAEINRATDCAARLVTAVGLPTAVTVLVDAALDTEGTLWTPTGESGTAVALHGADLPAVTGGRVVALTSAPPPVVDLTAHEERTVASSATTTGTGRAAEPGTRQRATVNLDAEQAPGPGDGGRTPPPPWRLLRA